MRKRASEKAGKEDVARAEQSLTQLRTAFLALHKTLLESERVGYEQAFGTIASAGDFLQLAIHDPWFAWLRPLSEFITSLDERLEGEQHVTVRDVKDLEKRGRALLVPQESGEGFARHYFEALQRDPDVVLAHGRIAKLRLD
jgi:predicted component of type VI protein secretion system